MYINFYLSKIFNRLTLLIFYDYKSTALNVKHTNFLFHPKKEQKKIDNKVLKVSDKKIRVNFFNICIIHL